MDELLAIREKYKILSDGEFGITSKTKQHTDITKEITNNAKGIKEFDK